MEKNRRYMLILGREDLLNKLRNHKKEKTEDNVLKKIKMLDQEIKGKLGESTCNIFNRSLVEFIMTISIDQIRKPSRQRLAMMRLSDSQECRLQTAPRPTMERLPVSCFSEGDTHSVETILWILVFSRASDTTLLQCWAAAPGQSCDPRGNSNVLITFRRQTILKVSLSGQCSINCTRYSTLL